MYVVVAYDIADDRRRARLAKKLIDFLPRVQMSVFEGELPENRLPRLRQVLEDAIDPGEDSVRIYQLCRRCRRNVLEIGNGTLPSDGSSDEVV